MFLWCAAGSSLGLGATGCIANPTPHPAEEDQDYEMGASEAGSFAAEPGASADEASRATTGSEPDAMGGSDVQTDDVIADATGDADDDALDAIGPDHGMVDADTIGDTDRWSPDSWDDAEEDVSEFDVDEPEAE